MFNISKVVFERPERFWRTKLFFVNFITEIINSNIIQPPFFSQNIENLSIMFLWDLCWYLLTHFNDFAKYETKLFS